MNSRYTFKAKTKDNQEWVYGSLLFDINTSGRSFIVENGVTSYESNDKFINEHINTYQEVDKDTLCQCTGLQDIEGNYIFENDICNMLDSRGNVIDKLKVIWSGEKISYQIVDLKNNHISFDAKCWLNNCKIIGNKFDEVEE